LAKGGCVVIVPNACEVEATRNAIPEMAGDSKTPDHSIMLPVSAAALGMWTMRNQMKIMALDRTAANEATTGNSHLRTEQ
jgi:hypothetical protein